MDLHGRLMAAMRSLDASERDVRSCLAAARARRRAEPDNVAPGTEESQDEGVATANLQTVLERRKELGRLWSFDLEEMKGDLEREGIERLLAPLSKF